MKKTEKAFAKITPKGRIVKIIREHYFREDVYCQSQICKKCKHENPILEKPLKQQKDNSINQNTMVFKSYLIYLKNKEYCKNNIHYIIPTSSGIGKFLEIFELNFMKNLIFCETIFDSSFVSTRSKNRIRNIVKDVDRRAIIFHNEHFSETFVKREESETPEIRDDRAILKVAEYYRNHLDKKVPIIVLTDKEISTNVEDIFIVKLYDYVYHWYPENTSLRDLYDSLILKEEDGEYENYLSNEVLEQGIKKGNFKKGILHVNPYRSSEAYLKKKGMEDSGEVLIYGRLDRNRAIHGDLVVVQLHPESEWKTSEIGKKTKTGKVVGILERRWRDYVGCIQLDQPKTQEWQLVIPLDTRIPKIRIKTKQRQALENCRIVVRIQNWERDSYYPMGFYVKTLGEIGDLNVETEGLLIENQISTGPFSKSSLSELPSIPYSIPLEEFKNRMDLRNLNVMSIDPIGCEDIDDALSVLKLSNGNYQIGVHIADVDAYVKHGSNLDLEARKRSTTIYLVDRRLDMLPSLLSTNLLSLRQGEDRLAVSVLWEITKKGKIISTKFGRSVVRNKYALHYQQAQNILLGKETPHIKEKNWEAAIIDPSDLNWVRENISILSKFARQIRNQRFEKGALELESLNEIKFSLDDNNMPIKINPKDHLEIHETVEEWMIYANHCVAVQIYKTFPENALLRRHPFPKKEHFEPLIKAANVKGFNIYTNSNSELSESLAKCVDPFDPFVNLLLRLLATRAMQEAEYFSTGSLSPTDFFHYGLALEFYTHFTSPIRRYSDVIVHRMLLQSLSEEPKPLLSNQELQKMCEYMNEKHRAAKNIQEESMDWFAGMYFKDKNLVEEGIIYAFRTNAMHVFVPSFSLKNIVFLTDKEGKVIVPETEKKCQAEKATIQFLDDVQKMIIQFPKKRITFSLFDHINVKILVDQSREHRPKIRFELANFKKNKILKKEKATQKQIKAIYTQSYEDSKNAKKAHLSELPIEGMSKFGQRENIFNFDDMKKEIMTFTVQETKVEIPNLEIEELEKKLKKIERRLGKIEEIKKKENISEEEKEILKTEEKMKKNLAKAKKKLKILKKE